MIVAYEKHEHMRTHKLANYKTYALLHSNLHMQFASAFEDEGLRSAEAPYAPYCDPSKMSSVRTPVYMICGDRDKMIPPQVGLCVPLQEEGKNYYWCS